MTTLRILPLIALSLFPSLSFAVGKGPTLPELKTVPHLSVERYLGKWYEIASFPQSFQRGCTAVTAEYLLTPSGDLQVVNECHLETPDGKLKRATGRAWIVDKTTNAKLKVQFFWPFSGDYWVIDLADDYSYAVVGAPDREYLWILSRTPTLSTDLYDKLLTRISEKHFDVSRLNRTWQPGFESAPSP